ncbi:MAG: hypothetical protein ABIG42_05150 [bacterium]
MLSALSSFHHFVEEKTEKKKQTGKIFQKFSEKVQTGTDQGDKEGIDIYGRWKAAEKTAGQGILRPKVTKALMRFGKKYNRPYPLQFQSTGQYHGMVRINNISIIAEQHR